MAPTIDVRININEIPAVTGRMLCDDVVVEKITAVFEDGYFLGDKIFISGVRDCARCGGDHPRVEFKLFEIPCGEWTYWGTCPANGDPIMTIMKDSPWGRSWLSQASIGR